MTTPTARAYTATPCPTCGYAAGPSKTQGLADRGQRYHSCAKWVARAERAARANAARAAIDRTPQPCLHARAQHEHGTNACYTLDRCRCIPCSQANSAAEHRRRRLRAYGRYDKYVDAGPVREHLAYLAASGIGRKRVALLAGVGSGTLADILYGHGGRTPTRRVTREVAAKVLAVTATPAVLAPGAQIPNIGTARRLQALMTLGWSRAQLAGRVGVNASGFRFLLHGTHGTTVATAAATVAAYDELWQTTPPGAGRHERTRATRSRNYAARHGFAPPMAWDDDTIDDPDATPDTGQPVDRSPLAENVDWYLTEVNALATTDEVADRLGVRPGAVRDALKRAGRDDLTLKLARNARVALGVVA